jgi:hypothetical protein
MVQEKSINSYLCHSELLRSEAPGMIFLSLSTPESEDETANNTRNNTADRFILESLEEKKQKLLYTTKIVQLAHNEGRIVIF